MYARPSLSWLKKSFSLFEIMKSVKYQYYTEIGWKLKKLPQIVKFLPNILQSGLFDLLE